MPRCALGNRGRSPRRCIRCRRFRLHAERPRRQPSRLRDAEPSSRLGDDDRIAERVVAVVDSGIDPSHADLAGAVLPGYDFVDRDTDPSDPPGGGHGTAVSGVAAARANNGVGGVGACFDCRLMPLRVLGRDNIALNTNTAAAIDYAVDHGAAVVNASIYGEHSPTRLHDAVARARAAGSSWSQRPGTRGTTTPEYPAAFPETISVGAATEAGTLASFSSRGAWVKVAAPDCAPGHRARRRDARGLRNLRVDATHRGSRRSPADACAVRERRRARTRDHTDRTPRFGTQFGLVDAAAALRAVGTPPPRLRPAIVGEAIAEQELEAFTGIWSGARGAATYRWERCSGDACAAIADATNRTYTSTSSDAGSQLRVVVSASGLEPAAHRGRTPSQCSRACCDVLPSRTATRRDAASRAHGRVGGHGPEARSQLAALQRGLCDQVAIAPSYKVRLRDRGYRLKAEVVASNSVGTANAFSKLTAVVR